MKFAQLNPVGLVLNIVDLTSAEAEKLTTELVPIADGQDPPSSGDSWDGVRFVANAKPADSPEDVETIRSIAKAALIDRQRRQDVISRVDPDTATKEELSELLAALAE